MCLTPRVPGWLGHHVAGPGRMNAIRLLLPKKPPGGGCSVSHSVLPKFYGQIIEKEETLVTM